MPPERRRMTVPSKTWTRSRVPSTTRAETLTVSPAASSGMSVRICSCKFTIDPYSAGGGATALRCLCGPQPGRGKGASEEAAMAAEGEEYHKAVRQPSARTDDGAFPEVAGQTWFMPVSSAICANALAKPPPVRVGSPIAQPEVRNRTQQGFGGRPANSMVPYHRVV